MDDGRHLEGDRHTEADGSVRIPDGWYPQIVQASPNPIVIVDTEGIILAGNHAFQELAAPNAEIVGVPVGRFIGEPEGVSLQTMHKRALAGEILRNVNLTLSGHDGIQREMISHVYALRSAEGQVEGCVIAGTDFSEHLEAESVLHTSQERFHKLVQNSSDIIAVLDEKAVVQYVSPSITYFFGYAPGDLAGQVLIDKIHPDDQALAWQTLREALRQEGGYELLEVRLLHANGHWVHTETIATNLINEPTVRGLLLNTRDISERIAYEEGLIREKEQAESIAHLKNTIINNISHEIRTPLTAILGFAEVLSEELPVEQQEFASLIYSSGTRLLETLNSVLDFARLESGEMTLEAQRIELGEMVQTSALIFERQARQKELAFTLHTPADTIYLSIDPSALNRIVSNLISNAIKFTDVGEIGIKVFGDADDVGFYVSDTGIGIPDSFLPYLFDEFKQGSEGLARQHGGSGLGLAITQRLVTALGGRIEVESALGEGSRFTVLFPRR